MSTAAPTASSADAFVQRPDIPTTEAAAETIQRKKDLKEQRAREAARKAEREANGGAAPQAKAAPLRFKPREWAAVEGLEKLEVQGTEITLMTWNLLAQALVRRELFPNSDMLKIKDRVPSLMQEVLHYSPDIVCMQEVDRLSDHLPSLTLTHGYTSYIGYPNKSHGLLIAHKTALFEKVAETGIRLDELPIDDSYIPSPAPSTPTPSSSNPSSAEADSTANGNAGGESLTHASDYDGSHPVSRAARKAAGLSRSTRNVGLFVALKFKGREGGVVVGTTHLFWHPQHVYERVRQTGILMREAKKFREQEGGGAWRDWPLFLAGDFNSQPREMTYALLSHLPLTSEHLAELEKSSVVHQSVDLLHDPSYVPPPESEEQKAAKAHSVRSGKPLSAEEDEDKVIKHCRAPEDADGLAGLEELKALFGYPSSFGDSVDGVGRPRVRSAYGEIGGRLVDGAGKGNHYIDRAPEVQSGSGWVVKEDEEVVRRRKEAKDEDERVRRGDYEPMWSNFTPLWRLSIDYIFLLPPSPSSSPPAISVPKPEPRWTALLLTHPTADLGLGLPRLGICGSDHVALAAKVEIPPSAK